MMVKPSHLYAITLSTVILVVTAWFFGVYAPLNSIVEQQQQQIGQYRDQFSRMSAMNVLRHTLAQSVEQATLAFDSYRSEVDYSNDVHNGMLYLMAQADQLAITVDAFFADVYEDKDWYAKQGLTLDMSGSYEKLVNFLHLCADSDYLFQIKSSTFTPISHGIFHLKASIDLIMVK